MSTAARTLPPAPNASIRTAPSPGSARSSAAASSAYLTASEIFPLETRALAIAIFYALGTAVGGTAAPLLFGYLVESGSAWALAAGYAFAASLMLAAAAIAAKFGIDAEMRSLESIAEPLSSGG